MIKKLEVLKDVLEDFLELKAALSGRNTRPLKDFLFAQSLEEQEIFPVEGFRLDRNLVLLENEISPLIENLVFLRSRKGTFRVTRLRK